jgi:hypothetical protein
VKQWAGCVQLMIYAVFSTFYPRAWPWWPPETGLFYLPPPSPTQNIGSAPANFSSSLALFLQRNKQFKKYLRRKQERGLQFICIKREQTPVTGGSTIQNWVVRINKTYTDISIKVTILKRKGKYIWGFMTFLKRRERVQCSSNFYL